MANGSRKNALAGLATIALALSVLCSCAGGAGSPAGDTLDVASPEAADGQQTEGPGAQQKGSSTKITAEEAKRIMADTQAYTLVDVRSEDEYDEAHIEGAVLIPLDTLAERAGAELPDLDAAVLVYCRSGVRSAKAAETLAGLGYTKVYDIGGINDWPYGTV